MESHSGVTLKFPLRQLTVCAFVCLPHQTRHCQNVLVSDEHTTVPVNSANARKPGCLSLIILWYQGAVYIHSNIIYMSRALIHSVFKCSIPGLSCLRPNSLKVKHSYSITLVLENDIGGIEQFFFLWVVCFSKRLLLTQAGARARDKGCKKWEPKGELRAFGSQESAGDSKGTSPR